ncbi:iron ABC transporter permease [bacterium]|nr:iron ABC transporter permease [bacterium]MCK4325457.1 iron ABC transporter permease [bacterium]MCK4436994.1 iron ABC transporter permease [bacterium]
MERKVGKWMGRLILLALILMAVSLLALSLGPAHVPLSKIFHPQGIESIILFKIRLPRIILGLVVGAALAVAGVIFQGMFRNPLVEPYTLGVSGGAALGVSLSVIAGFRIIPLAGFLGALGAISLVYFIARRQGILRISMLLLTGVMISFIASAIILLIMSLAQEHQLHGILFWIMGSLEETNPSLIKLVSLIILIAIAISFLFSRVLNVLSLGEEEALHLGVNIERTKRTLFILGSLMAGAAVSVSGIIGFVGLLVPHFMRLLVGPDHRILLPTSCLAGGIFLVLSDTIARTIISPLELPVGVITGILGGSLFIYFLTKRTLKLGK